MSRQTAARSALLNLKSKLPRVLLFAEGVKPSTIFTKFQGSWRWLLLSLSVDEENHNPVGRNLISSRWKLLLYNNFPGSIIKKICSYIIVGRNLIKFAFKQLPMKADVQYNDLRGTVAADISDFTTQSNTLVQLATFFKIDQKRFSVVGVSVYGTENFYVTFICVDKQKSTPQKEHIVNININEDYEEILSLLFKRLHIVLYDRFDQKYPLLECDEECSLSDFESAND